MVHFHWHNENLSPEVKETKIILPSYQSYIGAKTDFQRGDISKEKVLRKLDTLSEEREKINALINDINVGSPPDCFLPLTLPPCPNPFLNKKTIRNPLLWISYCWHAERDSNPRPSA